MGGFPSHLKSSVARALQRQSREDFEKQFQKKKRLYRVLWNPLL